MARLIRPLLALWLAAAPLPAARAGDALAVVAAADSGLSALPLDAVKLIYARKSQVDGQGRRWVPVNLPAADPLRRTFSLTLFAALPEEQEDYWNIQYFHGISPPEVLASEEAVLRFVAATPGAVGYVRAGRVDARVKVLLVLHVPGPDGKRP
jgi:hypothetical protein